MAIALLAAAVLALVAALWRRTLRNAVHQGGRRVGSARLDKAVPSGPAYAKFVIIRVEPSFQEAQPFEHRGVRLRIDTYVLASAIAKKDSGAVLAQSFHQVLCQVLPKGR